MNYSSIPTVTGSSLRRSETNNLVETKANPFSFMSQDDGKETASLRMIRNFTYNCNEKNKPKSKRSTRFWQYYPTKRFNKIRRTTMGTRN